MKIIVDTNIYYYLGDGTIPFELYRDRMLAPTFLNIIEFSKTGHLIKHPEMVREALRKMLHYKNNVIYEPPFLYLAAIYCGHKFDPVKEILQFLEFTTKVAEGEQVDPAKGAEFYDWAGPIKARYAEAADFVNRTAAEIKERIEDVKAHKQKDTYQLTMQVIDMFVKQNTNAACDLMDRDLSRSELLIKTMDTLFKRLETTPMQMVPNDWFDLAFLAYVEPGDLFWTREKKWRNLIREAGCEHYLFTERADGEAIAAEK